MSLFDNLISYWPLNEASGNAVDLHGGNTLINNNSVGSGTGMIYPAARDFEKDTSQYLSLTDNDSLSVAGNVSFTIAVWVKAESLTGFGPMIASKFDGSTIIEYSLYYVAFGAQQRFAFTVSDDESNQTPVFADNFGAASTGVWYFVVAWHDEAANTVNISINNGTANSLSHATGIYDGAGPFNIGASNGTSLWDGLIGPVAFWKRVLTADERTVLYNSGNGLQYEVLRRRGAVGLHSIECGGLNRTSALQPIEQGV